MTCLAIFPLIVLASHLMGGLGDPEIAFAPAAQLARDGAADAVTLVTRARAAMEAHQLARAFVLARLAELRAPDAADPPLVAGLAQFRDGHPERAIAPFTRAAARAPSSATARFNLASALYEAGRADDAEPTYLQAASLDEKVAPLALLNAGISAAAAHPERAVQHFTAAEQAARTRGQLPIAERAARDIAELQQLRINAAAPELRRLAHAGKRALIAHRFDEAADDYRQALALAERSGTPGLDRAELQYGLGHALYRQNDLVKAARAFSAALAINSKDPDFHFMLGLVHFDAGADTDARESLERALALGLAGDSRVRARQVLTSLRQGHRSESARFYLELRAGAGYDSNVPQSGIILSATRAPGTTTTTATSTPTAAGYLSAAADIFWRPAGTPQNGLALDYKFGQIAYLSSALDPYSLQEHDLTTSAAWSPHPRVTLESGVDAYLLFEGVQTFAPFQWGLSLGPRLTIREKQGFETRARYQHVFKYSLDPYYNYLSGNHDEAGVQEVWRNPQTRVSVGYLFAHEAVGTQLVALGDLVLPIALPGSYDPSSVYFIPYSYLGHEASLSVTRDLPIDLRATLTLRYEHRDYQGDAYIERPSGSVLPGSAAARIDDRFSADIAVRYLIGKYFALELDYSFILNASTIDNTRPATPLQYDDKSYLRHVISLEGSFLF
jgi:tetratricopeptide (TPR) repeat protein